MWNDVSSTNGTSQTSCRGTCEISRGSGLEGKVTFVSPRAEFTPRNVQTAEERSKLVYRIKVTVDNAAGVLKLGMPVDAELKLQ